MKQARTVFAANHADRLAQQVDADALRLTGRYSSRFVWFGTDDVLTLVVGAQEEGNTDLALAIGLARRGERELRLVLPHGWHEPTLYRWARLRDDLPLRVWTYDVHMSYDVLADHVSTTGWN
ncbi:hypothetical protein [Cellulomonas phragmiteti]|uniref:hypothetical protein n=1 Tax=Cellulomonas phragmiteti TaxID=478780 RepID=UPI00366EBAE0